MLPQTAESPREVRGILASLWRRKWIILACAVGGMLLAMFYTSRQTEQYSASSQVLISGRESDQVVESGGQTSPQVANRQLENELTFIRSDQSKAEVASRVDRPTSVQASRSADSDTITFKATGPDPEKVALTANVSAEVYVELRAQRVIDDYLETASVVQAQLDKVVAERAALVEPVEEFRDSLDPNATGSLGEPIHSEATIAAYEAELAQMEAEIAGDLARLDSTIAALQDTLGKLELSGRLLEEGTAQVTKAARVPNEPFSPDVTKNVLLGFASGLVLGLAIALALEFLDQSLKSKDDIERITTLPVLASIPNMRGWRRSSSTFLATNDDAFSQAAESYRTLRTSIEFVGIDLTNRKVLITSSESSAGKSATVANLAVALANAGHSVLAIDCDLRKPRLHEFFEVDPSLGFTSVILGRASATDAVQPIESISGLHVLPSGPIPQFPAELLLGERTERFIKHLGTMFDYVLIDSPPVLAVSDALVLSRHVDSVVLVVRSRKTTAGGFTQTVEMLEKLDAPLAGAVLNCARIPRSHPYGYKADDKPVSGMVDTDISDSVNGSGDDLIVGGAELARSVSPTSSPD